MTGEGVRPVRRALVSVADKSGLEELGRRLAAAGAAIVSSGSTAGALAAAGIPVTPVSDVTGFPEMLGGRVKTLHPRVHGGILADTRNPDHLRQLEEQGIEPFELVVVNLYPFEKTIAAGATGDEAVEQIDIGGPTLVRAAAKNFESVAVVVDPGGLRPGPRRDRIVGRRLARRPGCAWRRSRSGASRPTTTRSRPGSPRRGPGNSASGRGPSRARGPVVRPCRPASLRREPTPAGRRLRGGGRRQVRSAAPRCCSRARSSRTTTGWTRRRHAGSPAPSAGRPACVIVKHNNPCGVAVAGSLADAYRRAYEGDTVSAFGGIVAFTDEVDEAAAKAMEGVFTEVVVAPGYSEAALGGPHAAEGPSRAARCRCRRGRSRRPPDRRRRTGAGRGRRSSRPATR